MTRSRRIPLPIIASFVLLGLMVMGSLLLAVRLTANNDDLVAVSEYRRAVTDVVNAARDAETGQRGFLLTGDEKYLAPYEASVSQIAPALARVASREGARGMRVSAQLKTLLDGKLEELRTTIELDKAGRADAAIAIVQNDGGRVMMDRVRAIAENERRWGVARTNELTDSSRTLLRLMVVGLVAGAAAVILLSLLWLAQARRQYAEVDRARGDAELSLSALKTEVASREKAESQVRQLQKMESLGALTGGIAHDFNNMLAVVLGGIELAKRRLRSDPDKADQLLDNAREGATRAATLTARLLAFARNQPLAPTPLDVNKLVGGMCDMLHRTLGEAVQVECVYGAGLWRCYADPGEVENAILNLAINARDAMPQGGKLTVESANAHIDDSYARSRPEVTAGQYVLICVTDTGSGMSPETIERAFDPFFTTKPVGKGTGLGLSQVFGFAKQSGGHVAAYSEIGEGTTVKLYLPRFTGADIVDPVASVPDALPGGVSTEVILVVEDEARVRHYAVDALRELGYTAISAASPAEALRALDEQPEITLLFTDIVMPEMTGRQLADAAAIKRPDLKILFTTGYTRNAVVHNGMIDVGVAFLSKPYGMRDLARKIRDVLDGGGVNRTV
ncbi:CHASE3 domain-containing protein [Sphingomonas sp. SUN039]|uniref:CHASE3 domain-containing protein n=1 Tax=Sphingomonas sp. SUN039 TaxID=2937787 RepID=UPI002164AA8B|nr:CHASE3 domain-containing protein [Sphingomonas sp. SUN039]UVO54335.1 CHASE3 domain-containing protein [Sphingomonas sp. SUN039]